MGSSTSSQTIGQQQVEPTFLSFATRVSALEAFFRDNNLNLNLTKAYQQIGLVYNQFKNRLDGVEESLDKQIADFDKLVAYVNTLTIKNIPPEISYEFDRLSALIKKLFLGEQFLQDRIDITRPIIAYASMPDVSGDDGLEQKAGTIYPLSSNWYASDQSDVMMLNNGIYVKRPGTYKLSGVVTIVATGGGAGLHGHSGVGLYMNGSLLRQRFCGTYWGKDCATIIFLATTNSPATFTIGCSKSWDENAQKCSQAALLVERVYEAPIPPPI